MDQKPLVLVTGISGFIGAQVCFYFLKHGGFRVRGTMRSIKEESQAPLRKGFGDLFDNLELAAADLQNEQSIIDACEGCTYIVHTASPVVFQVNDPEELIRPAVDGTLSALKGALKHKAKRVVVTSSVASVSTGNTSKLNFDASDWTDPSQCGAYAQSKTYAEKAAWDFLKDLKEEDRFELATICPGFVFGPTLNGRWSAAGDFVKRWVKNGCGSNDPMPSVDVRDVAEAHLQAILKPEAAGKRFLLIERNLFLADCYNIVVENLPGKNMTKAVSDGDDTKKKHWDNTPTKEILGIPFISYEKSTKDLVQNMIEHGCFDQ